MLNELKENLDRLKKPSPLKQMFPEEIKQYQIELEESIETIIDNHLKEKEFKTVQFKMKEKMEYIQANYQKTLENRDELSKKIKYEVGRLKMYLNSSTFYSKDMLFEANKLEGRILDLDEVRPEKLHKLMVQVEKEFTGFQTKLKVFFKIQNDVKALINSNHELTGNQKQELYFYVQNGEFSKAQDMIDKYSVPSGRTIQMEPTPSDT